MSRKISHKLLYYPGGGGEIPGKDKKEREGS